MSNQVHGYEELPKEQIDDPGGARAVFTRRRGSPPLFTVAFFKTYQAADENTKHTTFFTAKSLESLERVIPLAKKKLAELQTAAESGSER